VTWLIYGVWMSLAYGAGRFLESTWRAWAVAALVGLGPAGQLAMTSLARPIGGSGGWDAVLAFYVLLSGAIGLGVAIFLCFLGRARRANA
jgi:hypothetical protein